MAESEALRDVRERVALDHSSDPNFYRYYAEASLSAGTLERFKAIQEKIVRLAAIPLARSRALRVADIGCGAGTQALIWAEGGHCVHGLDINEPLIELGRRRAEEAGYPIRFDVGSATDLPYADQSMDVVMLPQLLEHVPDWQACLTEAVRVLAPGGVLYLSTTNVLCPVQDEFELPLYSWYPGFLKRRYERLAVSSRPELANYARYPAVHWFSHRQLAQYLHVRGISCFDRIDMVDCANRPAPLQQAVTLARRHASLRSLLHFCLPATILFGVKQA